MTNIERLERSIARELTRLIPQLKDPRVPLIVTVEETRLSKDGRSAKVLVSTLNEEDQSEMIDALNNASGYLQRELAKDVELKFTPRLSFTTSWSDLL